MYAGWGFSQAFYWQQEYKKMGYSSLEDFPGRGSDGDQVAPLKTINAKLIVLPAHQVHRRRPQRAPRQLRESYLERLDGKLVDRR